ncbi:MAG: OmpP1/FadL family transporter [Candidatus Zhuqueibacterota bacterium]
MKRFTSFSTFVIVLFLTTSLFASGVGLTGVGARATALGGAYRGVANDWSAMYWNPAGLSKVQGMHFGFSMERIKPTANYTVLGGAPIPFYRTDELQNVDKTFYIPAAGFVYSTEKFSFGLGVYVPFGLGATWDVFNTSTFNSKYPADDFEDDLKIIDIHPSIAYKVTDKLSIGVGFSYTIADIIIRTPDSQPNPLLLDPAYAQLVAGVLQPLGLASDAYKSFLVDKELDGTGSGIGFNFGVQYDLTEDMTIGIAGTWYNDISLDGKISATAYLQESNTTTIQTLDATLGQMVALGMLPAASKAQIMAVYSEPSVVYDKAKGDAKLPLPMTLGAGISYTGIKNMLIAADVSWTQWSAWDVIEITVEEDNSTSELVENWEDGIRFSAGLEYSLMENLKARGGYYTEPAAIPVENLTITVPDINRRHGINLGLSYNIGGIELFGSYEQLLIKELDVTSWEEHNMAGTYKMNAWNVMLGLGYNF